jgi:hypothetical protein
VNPGDFEDWVFYWVACPRVWQLNARVYDPDMDTIREWTGEGKTVRQALLDLAEKVRGPMDEEEIP